MTAYAFLFHFFTFISNEVITKPTNFSVLSVPSSEIADGKIVAICHN